MKRIFVILFFSIFAFNVLAQTEQKTTQNEREKPANAKSEKDSASLDLAKAALKAHGGDKFKKMKSLVIRGTADVSGSPTATFPATFAMILSGDKYRLEISNPFQPFKQVYDGQQTVSSVNNFTFPPINRLGLPLLQLIEEKGFTVTELPEKSRKKKGFRITSPEGYFTDFFVNEKTGQIKSYEASYDFNGREVTTSVEINKLREVEGVFVPERYAQRFDLGQLTMYADFKAKDILVNSKVEDDVFTMVK